MSKLEAGAIAGEEWRKIPGVRDHIEVSNLGRVRSTLVSPKRSRPTLFALRSTQRGYYFFSFIEQPSGKHKCCRVHRAVALAFLPNPEGKETVNHKDGNRLNNRLDNLEWATQKENNDHSAFVLSDKHHRTVFPFQYIVEIRELSAYLNNEQIGKIYGISRPHVSAIVNKKRRISA